MKALHPYVQLQVGPPPFGTPITTIPPEYLIEYRYTSKIGLSTVEVSLVDPTYEEIENLFINSDRNQEPLFFRHGYLDQFQQVSSNWIQAVLVSYSPNPTQRGMEITGTFLVKNSNMPVDVSTRTYSGKISDVVRTIAAELDLDHVVEDTPEEINRNLPADLAEGPGPRTWRTNGKSLSSFLDYLSELAGGGKAEWEWFVLGGRKLNRKPTLHFHSRGHFSLQRKTHEFTYLAGETDTVLEFRPNFSGRLLANIANKNLVMRQFDPVSKLYLTKAINRETIDTSDDIGEGDPATEASNKEEGKPKEDVSKAGGYFNAQEKVPGEAEARAVSLWKHLDQASYTATLTLVGLPTTVDTEADDIAKISVLLPKKTNFFGNFEKHWSSGEYQIREAVHTIGSSYTITCQLMRNKAKLPRKFLTL